MKKLLFLTICAAGLLMGCSQKQAVVTVPESQIDLQGLLDSIDYDMDISGLSLSDVHTLRYAPAATRGFPIKDSYVRGMYLTTTWYDSLMWAFEEKESGYYEKVPMKENEMYYDYFDRAISEANILGYSEQEQAFIKRLETREDELKKQNFEVAEGLRVNMTNLSNPKQIKDFDEKLSQQLAQDGFAIVPALNDQLFQVYEQNDYEDFPSFVTTDLYLQVFHLYIDCMLRELEEQKLLPMMADFSQAMFRAMSHTEGWSGGDEKIRAAAFHNSVFYDVAYQLFTGQYIGDDEHNVIARQEVEKVMSSQNGFSDFMLDYKDVQFAYSLFRPRGHYSRTEKLQRYFRGMMWLQTVPFGMNHKSEIEAAVLMAYALKDDASLQKKYNELNDLIAYLMGQPDNLSLPQVIKEVEKTGMQLEDLLNNDQAMDKLAKTLEEIGNEQTRIRPPYERTSHNKINLMPQRYQPDAEVLLKMVDYKNKPTRRATPKGSDFFAAMGVAAAEQILKEEKSEWKELGDQLKAMKQRMGEIDWNETTCTQWMNTLKVLTDKDQDAKLPYFMVTPEWDLKNLNAALASWAELKHDAILYAKQPFGAECGGGGPPEPIVKGYVEPNVKFWKKALELLDNTAKTLKAQNMLTEKLEQSTERLHDELEFLLNTSEKELAGKPLSDEENGHIEYIGATFENISLDLLSTPDQTLYGWSDIQSADKKVALVADVYTANADNNPNKSILFEAVGDADEIYVVVEIEGYLYLMRGAVLSYREFLQSIDEQRLTDEEWQKMLEKDPRKGVPEWMKRIIVPLNKMPEPNGEVFYSSGC